MTPLCQGVHAPTELPELCSLQGARTLLPLLLLYQEGSGRRCQASILRVIFCHIELHDADRSRLARCTPVRMLPMLTTSKPDLMASASTSRGFPLPSSWYPGKSTVDAWYSSKKRRAFPMNESRSSLYNVKVIHHG